MPCGWPPRRHAPRAPHRRRLPAGTAREEPDAHPDGQCHAHRGGAGGAAVSGALSRRGGLGGSQAGRLGRRRRDASREEAMGLAVTTPSGRAAVQGRSLVTLSGRAAANGVLLVALTGREAIHVHLPPATARVLTGARWWRSAQTWHV